MRSVKQPATFEASKRLRSRRFMIVRTKNRSGLCSVSQNVGIGPSNGCSPSLKTLTNQQRFPHFADTDITFHATPSFWLVRGISLMHCTCVG